MKRLCILQILNIWRLVPAYICILTSPKELKYLVIDELNHWKKCDQRKEKSQFSVFCGLMLERKEYRSLLHYRFNQRGLRKVILKFLFPSMETLYISTPKIGPRLYIQHGFSTMISAKSMGSDCWINQQVTIGYTFANEPPVIGNGVRISAGAKVVGDITIGDNVIIAANAAVVKNVPENAVVGGVPAKIIAENIEHKLYKK